MLHAIRRRLRTIPWLYKARLRAIMRYRRWRLGLKHVHPTFYMNGRSRVYPDLVAHEYVFMNWECFVCAGVEIGAYTMFAPRVAVVGADHATDKPGEPMIFAGRPPLRRTVIEADVWVGFGATVMAGVRLGRGSVIAAGAVVVRDVPPYEIHGGVPAKKIGERFPDPEERARHDEMLREPPRMGTYAGRMDEG